MCIKIIFPEFVLQRQPVSSKTRLKIHIRRKVTRKSSFETSSLAFHVELCIGYSISLIFSKLANRQRASNSAAQCDSREAVSSRQHESTLASLRLEKERDDVYG
jgi:hypothetical protein